MKAMACAGGHHDERDRDTEGEPEHDQRDLDGTVGNGVSCGETLKTRNVERGPPFERQQRDEEPTLPAGEPAVQTDRCPAISGTKAMGPSAMSGSTPTWFGAL